MADLLSQIAQFTGAFILLACFVKQLAELQGQAAAYLLANAMGSALMTGAALWERQWGFALLDGAWAVASIVFLLRLWRLRRAGPHGSAARVPQCDATPEKVTPVEL